MAKRSDIEAQIAALTDQLGSADDDDDYEVWVKNDKGHETKVPSKRAAGWLQENFGISLTDLPEAGSETETTEETTEKKTPPAGFFGNRKS
jgi:hypothetical protein